MRKLICLMIIAVAFSMMPVLEGPAFAAEEGTGHYVPGALADFGDMAPASGLALISWYNHYNGSFDARNEHSFDITRDGRIFQFNSREISFGGILASNVQATSNAEMFGGLYTFPCSILGGKYSMGIIVPYVWLDVSANINLDRNITLESTILNRFGKEFSFAHSRTATANDSTSGIGDITLVPFYLGWTKGDFRWAAQLNVYAPTGDFSKGQLANVGLNYWTFEPMASFSYISKKIGLEITTTAGFDFNTNNNATDYQSGDVFHTDITIAEHFPICNWGIFGVGVNGYYWKQFNGDSGSGARLGSFETLMTGVGPVVSYISPKFWGDHTIVAEVKWLPQMDTHYTLNGNYVWFKAALAF